MLLDKGAAETLHVQQFPFVDYERENEVRRKRFRLQPDQSGRLESGEREKRTRNTLSGG